MDVNQDNLLIESGSSNELTSDDKVDEFKNMTKFDSPVALNLYFGRERAKKIKKRLKTSQIKNMEV